MPTASTSSRIQGLGMRTSSSASFTLPVSWQNFDWNRMWRVIAIGVIFVTLYGLYYSNRTDIHSWREVQLWLKEHKLDKYGPYFKEKGVTTLQHVLDLHAHQDFSEFTVDVQNTIESATNKYRELTRLQLWLKQHGFYYYVSSFEVHMVTSLSDLVNVAESTLQHVMSIDYSLQDYGRLKLLIQQLHENNLPSLKSLQQDASSQGFGKYIWNFSGFLLFSALVGLLIFAINNEYGANASPTNRSLIAFVTGKYLDVKKCTVDWLWEEPQTVGNTVSFDIKFFQRNGRPYEIGKSDGLLVDITHNAETVLATVQLGTKDKNVARVTFTVHRAGDYCIAVMVATIHIHGSPFGRHFKPDDIDPSNTVLLNQSAIVVCVEQKSCVLQLELHDRYGNRCNPGTLQRFRITVTQHGSDVVQKPQLYYDAGSPTVEMFMYKTGFYQAEARIDGVRLKNANFNILVINEVCAAEVSKSVATKSHNVYHKAYVQHNDKAKKVYCYISPKQITIKEFRLKIFPVRLFTFRVCPSTKLQFLEMPTGLPVLVINDGCQPPLQLRTKYRDIIAATFTQHLLNNIGGSETFKDKQDFFFEEVRRLHGRRPHSRLSIRIQRSQLFESSLKAVEHLSTSDWCKNFEIKFQGEEGLDWGGLRREWFELLCRELFDPNGIGLFCRFSDSSQALVHPNPRRPVHLKLKLYEFAGHIVGKCLYESALGRSYRQLVNARFTRSFLAQLIGLRVTHKYFEHDDPELYVSKVKYIEENSVEGMELMFSEEEYRNGQLHKEVELVPGGAKIPVTDDNKRCYLDALAQYKFSTNVHSEIEAFLKGLNELISDNLLSIFDENELELLMCGTGHYSVSEFKEHHVVCGSSSSNFGKIIEWFWVVVGGFTQQELAQLLQFTTGCSQLPPGGFAELCPKFQISASMTYGNLPTAHTCFNQLCLPFYDSLEELHHALQLAINEGSQGFALI